MLGFAALVGHRHIIKKIFGLTIINNAVVIFFVVEGSRIGSSSPILSDGAVSLVDPVPQALMLTAIVIGVCVNALALALAYRLHQATGSFMVDEIYQRINQENTDD